MSVQKCRCGGTGRRTGLKILRTNNPCRFDSGHLHQKITRSEATGYFFGDSMEGIEKEAAECKPKGRGFWHAGFRKQQILKHVIQKPRPFGSPLLLFCYLMYQTFRNTVDCQKVSGKF